MTCLFRSSFTLSAFFIFAQSKVEANPALSNTFIMFSVDFRCNLTISRFKVNKVWHYVVLQQQATFEDNAFRTKAWRSNASGLTDGETTLSRGNDLDCNSGMA